MPTIKFTERAIARIEAPTVNGSQQLFWDAELRGFGVLVSGVSNAKTYIVQRALPNGKTRRVTIGRTNVLALADATQRAKQLLATFYKGLDPKAGRLGDHTLRSALDEYLRTRTDLRPRSVAGYREAMDRYLNSWLDLPLRVVTRQMVEDRFLKIAKDIARDGEHSGHATANGVMRALRALYNFAADRADPANPMPQNPVRLKKVWFKIERRTRCVGPSELPRFYEGVVSLANPVARDFLLLMLFTGLRRGEAASLRWEHVDFKGRVLRLPAASTKARRKLDLPMTDFIHDLLVARRAIGNAAWVFPSVSRSGHIEEPKFPLEQIAEATGIRVSAHDLRRTFITVAKSTDVSAIALKALVNHSLGQDVTEGYIQITAERLREPAQRVTDKLKELCGITDVTDERVTRLKTR